MDVFRITKEEVKRRLDSAEHIVFLDTRARAVNARRPQGRDVQAGDDHGQQEQEP